MWLCQCECGNYCIVDGHSLKRGHTKSCGCLALEIRRMSATKHNLVNSKIYRKRQHMKARCYNKNSKDYKYYGGRGIKICDEWLDKENGLMNFYNWAMSNGYKDDLTIDRIDVNGNYEPSNCRWITAAQQKRNRRNNILLEYNNETHCVAEWSRLLNIPQTVIRNRIKKLGWSVEKALTTPLRLHKVSKEVSVEYLRSNLQ